MPVNSTLREVGRALQNNRENNGARESQQNSACSCCRRQTNANGPVSLQLLVFGCSDTEGPLISFQLSSLRRRRIILICSVPFNCQLRCLSTDLRRDQTQISERSDRLTDRPRRRPPANERSSDSETQSGQHGQARHPPISHGQFELTHHRTPTPAPPPLTALTALSKSKIGEVEVCAVAIAIARRCGRLSAVRTRAEGGGGGGGGDRRRAAALQTPTCRVRQSRKTPQTLQTPQPLCSARGRRGDGYGGRSHRGGGGAEAEPLRRRRRRRRESGGQACACAPSQRRPQRRRRRRRRGRPRRPLLLNQTTQTPTAGTGTRTHTHLQAQARIHTHTPFRFIRRHCFAPRHRAALPHYTGRLHCASLTALRGCGVCASQHSTAQLSTSFHSTAQHITSHHITPHHITSHHITLELRKQHIRTDV